jgi:hydrogenase expression/formation protein HypE
MEPETVRWTCPSPAGEGAERILLAHGEGGRLTRRLLRERIFPRLGFGPASAFPDAARLAVASREIAFCTDAYTVTPLFFPGGDIGSLAVHGTANDLAVAGARPRWLSLSLIVEEGLALEDLDRVLESAARAAREVGASIVTGDTKVAPQGSVDKLFVTTTGIGEILPPAPAGPESLETGDLLICSGPIGRHGVAILCSREGIALAPPPQSDMADLWPAVEAMRNAGVEVRAMRDATRGGIAAVLHEWSGACERTVVVREPDLPLTADVRGACELLGLDPVFLACEGVMLVGVRPGDAPRALEALRSTDVASRAAVVGRVEERGVAPVVLEGGLGNRRPLDEPVLPSMPRIC